MGQRAAGKHFLPIDHNLHGAEPTSRRCARGHVHGAKVPPESDGYPEDWFVPGKSRSVYYPNQQDAAMLWYHDHAMGINRLNIYAGLLRRSIIRDERGRCAEPPRGKYEIPLVIYDRLLARRQLLYPVSENAQCAMGAGSSSATPSWSTENCFLTLKSSHANIACAMLNASNGRFYHFSFGDGMHVSSDRLGPGTAASAGRRSRA